MRALPPALPKFISCECCGTPIKRTARIVNRKTGATLVIGLVCYDNLANLAPTGTGFPSRGAFLGVRKRAFVDAFERRYVDYERGVDLWSWRVWFVKDVARRPGLPAPVGKGISELSLYGFLVTPGLIGKLIRYHDHHRRYPRQVLLPAGWHRYARGVPDVLTIDQAGRILREIRPRLQEHERRLAEQERRRVEAWERKERQRRADEARAFRERVNEVRLYEAEAKEAAKRLEAEARGEVKRAERRQRCEDVLRELIKSFNGDLDGFRTRAARVLSRPAVKAEYANIRSTQWQWQAGRGFGPGHLIEGPQGWAVVESSPDPHPWAGRSMVRYTKEGELTEIRNRDATNVTVWCRNVTNTRHGPVMVVRRKRARPPGNV